MFRKNENHKQSGFFDIESLLSASQQQAFQDSKERWFYELVFKRIDESLFSPLYSDEKSRPNAPINCLVSALILLTHNRWSYSFLLRQIRFDILTRKALGLNSLDEIPFCEATIFNFQKKLLAYEVETGENLVEKVFDGFTKEQLSTLKLKTDMQRCDSVQVQSNIRSYSRIQLLIEVLLRVVRVLIPADIQRFSDVLEPYQGKTSGQYVYAVTPGELGSELDKIAYAYGRLRETVLSIYGQTDIASIFNRVFDEHFTMVQEKIVLRPTEELHSGCLQSPDDTEATYRKKRGIGYRGHLVTAAETCNPENPIQLITDVTVTANNVDDSAVLNDRIDGIKEKTPDIDMLFTDGGYGSEPNDVKLHEHAIQQVQTAIRGRKGVVDMEITTHEDGTYTVQCPHQCGVVVATKKRWKAVMNKEICSGCPHRGQCPSKMHKRSRVVYFDSQDARMQKRHRIIRTLPVELRNLRANVEATMKEFSRLLENKKLKIRGLARTKLFSVCAAFGINIGRVYRYVTA